MIHLITKPSNSNVRICASKGYEGNQSKVGATCYVAFSCDEVLIVDIYSWLSTHGYVMHNYVYN